MAMPLERLLGDPLTDPEEDAFVVFSQAIPSQSLGFIDCKAATVDLTVAGRDLSIHHSRGLLTSNRKEGTTGAVVWKVTPPFAEWIASSNFLDQAGYLSCDAVALELGAGVSGVVASTLGPRINTYIATDQDYVLNLLRQNILTNRPPEPRGTGKRTAKLRRPQAPASCASGRIETLELDWEHDVVASMPFFREQAQASADGCPTGVDLVIACDTIYNETLIEPLNNMCVQICRLRPATHQRPTLCVIAQQLRTFDIFEKWLTSFHKSFHVWQVPDHLLTPPLRENTGFIVHVGRLR